MLGTLQIPTQLVHGPLSKATEGTPFEFRFPEPVAERPYLGQNYRLVSVNLRMIYVVRLASAQIEEQPPTLLNFHLELMRGLELVAQWQLDFQMREVPASAGLEWIGEESVFADLVNAIDYTVGQTLTFRVSGIVPGKLS
jgi:hypothetical protein